MLPNSISTKIGLLFHVKFFCMSFGGLFSLWAGGSISLPLIVPPRRGPAAPAAAGQRRGCTSGAWPILYGLLCPQLGTRWGHGRNERRQPSMAMQSSSPHFASAVLFLLIQALFRLHTPQLENLLPRRVKVLMKTCCRCHCERWGQALAFRRLETCSGREQVSCHPHPAFPGCSAAMLHAGEGCRVPACRRDASSPSGWKSEAPFLPASGYGPL